MKKKEKKEKIKEIKTTFTRWINDVKVVVEAINEEEAENLFAKFTKSK